MVEFLNEDKVWIPVRTTIGMPCECFPEVKCDERGLYSMIEIKPSKEYNFVIVPKCFHYQPIATIHYRGRINFLMKEKEGEGYVTKYKYYSNEFVIKAKQQVTITTDKTGYEQGEEIKLTIKNNLEDKSIWYEDYSIIDLSFWKIEKFEKGKWISKEFRLPSLYEHYTPEYKISFLVGEDKVEKGEDICCYPVATVYDAFPFDVKELKPNSEIFYKWTQKNCLMEILQKARLIPESAIRSICFKPKFLEEGRYKFVFEYGLTTKYMPPPETVEHTGGTFIPKEDRKIIYSNEFTIKETK